MSSNILLYIMVGAGGIFAAIVIAYLFLNKAMQKSDYQKIRKLRRDTEEKKFSTEVIYQKLYITYSRLPFLKAYILKLRRRLEILTVEDEYATRRGAAKILTTALLLFFPVFTLTIILTHKNFLLLSILVIFEIFMIDTIIDSMVDKMDNNLLKEQLDFFAEIRHAYHEFNMVEEAI